MSSRTGTRVVPTAVLIGAVVYFAPEAVDKVGGFLGDLAGANDAVTIGEGETTLMVAANAEATVVNCEPATILAERSCGGLRILVVDAAKMPFIARNTKLAWESGSPAVLTMDRSKQAANRRQACRAFTPAHGGQCDEYPMAGTAEGGASARTDEVPSREQACQGGSYVRQYPPNGERFLVVVSRPDLIASGPFTGVDTAVNEGCP
jgi:hypothetical protein